MRLPLSLPTRAVAVWFHKRGRDGWTPALTLRDVLDVCVGALAAAGVRFTVGETPLRRLFCEALCVLYQGSPHQRALAFRRPPSGTTDWPAGWTEEHEALWRIYVDTELPDLAEALRCVGVCEWESDLPGWRDTLTSLFPYYMVREERLLIDAGLLVKEDDEEEDS